MIAVMIRTFTQPVDDTCGYKKYTRFMKYKHLFFDMDQTVAPSRQPILPEMYELLDSLPQDIVIVSGQDVTVNNHLKRTPSFSRNSRGVK